MTFIRSDYKSQDLRSGKNRRVYWITAMQNHPRLNRLRVDYQKIRELAYRSQYVDLVNARGDPPYEYELMLSCKGIEKLSGNKPVFTRSHRLKIILPETYPREKPSFTLLSNLFHPNVSSSGTVCIGNLGKNGWAPSMGLDDVVIRIIEMIRFENFSVTSAYNHNAANWVRNHRHLLPLENTQIVGEEILEITIIDTSKHETNIDDLLGQIRIA